MADDAIPAATLILVRDAPAGPPDILMVERAEGMAFAAGALVFPGGRIDEADRELGAAAGVDPALVAAIRETIEETAIPAGIEPLPSPELAGELQQALVGGRPFAVLLSSHGLSIDTSALTAFARWIPKFHAVRRFDTLFFVAPCPPGEWEPRIIPGECASATWLRASDVLEREAQGRARLIFPTRRTLERLAQHATFGGIRDDALGHAIEPVTPWVEERDGEKFITIPPHLGFPVCQERLEGQWRG